MTKSVIIDGVVYAPVTQSNPDMEKIARGLLMSFYGESNDRIESMMDGITVRVYDDGEGVSIQEVLADIANQLAKK